MQSIALTQIRFQIQNLTWVVQVGGAFGISNAFGLIRQLYFVIWYGLDCWILCQ